MANTKRKKGISKYKRQSTRRTRKSIKKEKYPANSIDDIERRYYSLDKITRALGLKIPENHDVRVRHLDEKDAYRVCIEIYKEKTRHDSYDDDDEDGY